MLFLSSKKVARLGHLNAASPEAVAQLQIKMGRQKHEVCQMAAVKVEPIHDWRQKVTK